MPNFSTKDLDRVNQVQIDAAGPRYSPNIDAAAPNLKIVALLDALDALGATEGYRQTIDALSGEITEAWDRSSFSGVRLFRQRRNTPRYCIRFLRKLKKRKPSSSEGELALLK